MLFNRMQVAIISYPMKELHPSTCTRSVASNPPGSIGAVLRECWLINPATICTTAPHDQHVCKFQKNLPPDVLACYNFIVGCAVN
jgi:hypothetical protein